jgi:hypothetical protein
MERGGKPFDYGDVWNIPNTLGVDNNNLFIDWNIVKTVNTITTIGNKQVGTSRGSNTFGANKRQ